MFTVLIECNDNVFEFILHSDSPAWYDLDGMESFNQDEKLRINADREVYAIYTDSFDTEHYGTIGDEENDTIPDNFPCESDCCYIFYEKPETKDYYV